MNSLIEATTFNSEVENLKLPIRPRLKKITGTVVKLLDAKTVKVQVKGLVYESKWKRYKKTTKLYLVHVLPQYSEQLKVGSKCIVSECRKISTLKHMIVVGIIAE